MIEGEGPVNMTKRQFQIVKTLYHTDGYLTFQEIADMLGVSVKTIRNDIAAIRAYIQGQNTGSIESKPHLGVKACINEQEWEKLLNSGQAQTDVDSEEQEILFFILQYLLQNGSLTALRLSERYYIGRTQLDKILEKASAWFSKNHIVFERRRGKGISIFASEFNFRLAVLGFFLDFKSFLCPPSAMRSSRFASMDAQDYTALCKLLDGFDVDNVAEALGELEGRFGFRFSYLANIMLLLMASMSMIRHRKGKTVEVPKIPECKTDGMSDALVSNVLAEELETRFSLILPKQEREYLRFAVSISEIQGFADDRFRRNFEGLNVELCQLTVKFIHLVSEITNVDLRDDKFFVTQMFLQLKAMIARLKYQAEFKNPLLRQIKTKYPNLMAMAWSASNIFEKELQLDINEDEVGYLALHIGGAIERSSANLRACIVCDYGIGISQILREKIQRAIPDLHITAVYSNRDLRSIKSEACDFVISTVLMGGVTLGKPLVTVGHLLDGGDVEKIEAQIRKSRVEKRSRKTGAKTLAPVRSLFTKELIFPQFAADSKDTLLQSMCARLEMLGYVSEGFTQSVLEREAHTSTEVGKGMALPHGHSKFVNRSVVAFAKLPKPILWFDGNEEVDLVFLLAFDLDEAKGMKDEIIKFYKAFVGFMEDASAAARLRRLTDEGEIIALFENW